MLVLFTFHPTFSRYSFGLEVKVSVYLLPVARS